MEDNVFRMYDTNMDGVISMDEAACKNIETLLRKLLLEHPFKAVEIPYAIHQVDCLKSYVIKD